MKPAPTGAELAGAIGGLDLVKAVGVVRSWGDVDNARLDDLLTAAGQAVGSDLELAALVLDVTDHLAAELEEESVGPAVNYLRARLALNQARPDDALDLIARSRAGWQALGRQLEAHRTELGRMNVLDDLGRHEEAAAAARSLRTSLDDLDRSVLDDEHLEQVRWMQAAANENLGVATGFTGQPAEALAAYEAAEKVYDDVGSHDGLARCRANRGIELLAVGRAVEGREALLSAAQMFLEANDRLSHAQCLGHVAEAEALLGRYADALDRFRGADGLLESVGATKEAIRLRLRTVRAYLALNLVDEASTLAADASRALEGAGMEHDLAEAEWLEAVALVRAERPDEALDLLRRAADGAASVGDPSLQARVLLTESEALVAIDDPPRARAAAAAALEAVAEHGLSIEEFHARLRLTQLLDDTAEVDEHLRQAEALADDIALPHVRYPLLVQLARRERERGDDAAARGSLEEAIEIVEGLRGLIADEMLRTSYLEGRTAAHLDLIAMLLDGAPGELATAFDLAEASKSRTLDDIMTGTVGLAAQGSDSNVELVGLQSDLNAAYSALTAGSGDRTRSRRSALQDRAVELEQAIRLARLQSETFPERLTTGWNHGPARRPESDERVVEYHIVHERIVGFVWQGGRLEVVDALIPTDRAAELISAWERTRQRYELARGLGTAGSRALVTAANDLLRELWVALFAPIAATLDGEGGDLLIVPHGMLHAVPFRALAGPHGPLGDRWTVTTAPSYAVANLLRARTRGQSGRSLVVGVPDESAPAVAREAGQVADALPGAELLLGDQGTVDNLIAATREPVDVLHLACHGIHRARNPMFSALKLSDRWLTAQEVMSLALPGALVVLSACESGRHEPGQHSEETIGLARSFVAAGAAAVIASLWMTSDRVAAETMTYFYGALETAAPASALQSAQIAVAGRHPHPADWAPFIIHGGLGGQP